MRNPWRLRRGRRRECWSNQRAEEGSSAAGEWISARAPETVAPTGGTGAGSSDPVCAACGSDQGSNTWCDGCRGHTPPPEETVPACANSSELPSAQAEDPWFDLEDPPWERMQWDVAENRVDSDPGLADRPIEVDGLLDVDRPELPIADAPLAPGDRWVGTGSLRGHWAHGRWIPSGSVLSLRRDPVRGPGWGRTLDPTPSPAPIPDDEDGGGGWVGGA